MKKEKMFSKKVIFIGSSIILVCVAMAFLVAVYARYATSSWAQGAAHTFHLPVLITWKPFSVLTAAELQWKLQSLRQFYEKQDFSSVGMRVDFTTEEGKKRLQVRERGLLNKYIEDQMVKYLAEKAGVRVTSLEADQSVERKMHEFSSEERVMDDLSRLYGWDLADFKKEVVVPDLYKEKLSAIFEARQDRSQDVQALKKIQEAQGRLNSGEVFPDVAKQYSEGSTVGDGGEIGWIDISQAEPALADAIEKLSVGEMSDITETSLGYHIVQLNETRKEAGVILYRISQIMTRKETFADWIGNSIRGSTVWVLLPEYEWNAETGYVEFTNPTMAAFEQENGFIQAEDPLSNK